MTAVSICAAAVLDGLIGDPRAMIHPVVLMGWLIQNLRRSVETWAGDHPGKLRLGGALITLILLLCSGGAGWGLERLVWLPAPLNWLGWALLTIGLASALAARSLRQSVEAVVKALPQATGAGGDLTQARQKLSWIVGRDVTVLEEPEILRAAAESASENAVDGLFAPLFWMLIGAGLWQINSHWPGPLALAWAFKATSTLDSMLGYRQGTLRWLGTAGARLDDLLTWMPCRLVMLSLPLVSRPWRQLPAVVAAAEWDGADDPSPNAGRSEAIYAHCAGVQLGGRNRYGQQWIDKPVLAKANPVATRSSVVRILRLTDRLELLWLLTSILILRIAQ